MKGLARLPERLVHGRRRDHALARLRLIRPDVRRVVFVCHGNICRSPFAARSFEAALPDPVRAELDVLSTGFYAEEGRTSPPEAVDAALRRAVDLSGHRSRSLVSGTGEVGGLDGAVVFVMEPGQRSRLLRRAGDRPALVVVLGDLDPEPIRRRGIRDPYGQPPEVFDQVFGRIQRSVRVAAGALAGRSAMTDG